MEQLNNPAWNAMISGNKNLANGNELVKYFDKTVSPFVGLKENSADEFEQLRSLVTHDRKVIIINAKEVEVPKSWNLLNVIRSVQMVFKGSGIVSSNAELVPLTKENVPDMLSLTKLTSPGPFEVRTIEFGHYYGIFDKGKLIAMAGQRMHIFQYAEISAVCTHPDYTGRGYARKLLQFQANRIEVAGGIPILHVKHDNIRAIKVYEDLGFRPYQKMNFFVLQKKLDDLNRA